MQIQSKANILVAPFTGAWSETNFKLFNYGIKVPSWSVFNNGIPM